MRIISSESKADWHVIPHSGLMSHWLANRPVERLAEPHAQEAEILVLLSTGHAVGAIADARLFKGTADAEMQSATGQDTPTSRLLREQHQSPKGYYSTDICRSLDFLNGHAKPVAVGDTGWLFICDQPFGEQAIPDHVGLRKGDGRRAFNNDFVYAGARVVAFAQVRITKVR